MTGRPCPTPSKIAYNSHQAAGHARGKRGHQGRRMRPYLCPCGRWHLSSQPKPDNEW